jgi:hypothetical protein
MREPRAKPEAVRSITPLSCLAIFLAIAMLAAPARAEFVTRILPAGVRVYDVAPSAAGLALVTSTSTEGERFRLLAPDGTPAGEPVAFSGPVAGSIQLALAPASGGGWIVVARNFLGPEAIWSVRLDAHGGLVSSPNTLVETVGYFILGPFGLATNHGTHLLVWSEDILVGDAIYARPLGDDGAPSGPRSTLMLVPLQIGAPLSPTVTPTSGGFFAAWDEIGQIVRARETKRSGAPVGTVEDVQAVEPGAVRPNNGLASTVGNREVVVYGMSGTEVSEIRGRLRTGSSRYDPAVVLAGGPFGDARAALHGLASRGEALGMLYTTNAPAPDMPRGWSLVEIDGDLRRSDAPRSLREEFGIEFVRATIDFDAYRNRWLVHGLADGPEGLGIYLIGLDANH